MADAAMTLLLETLSQMPAMCSDLTSGAEDELRLLGNEVESFRAFLRDTANKPKDEVPFEEMERQIEEAVNDAQDTIDSYLIGPAGQTTTDPFPGRRVPITELVSRLAEEVRSFREDRVKPILDKARIDFPHMLGIGEGSYSICGHELYDISNLFLILGGDLTSGAEEELRLLNSEYTLLSVFILKAALANREWGFFSIMMWQIQEVVTEAEGIISSYLSQASGLFRRRRDLYTTPVSSLAEVVRTLREDKVIPMMKKARIDLAEMLLIGDGFDATIEEAHQIKVNKVWSMGQDRSVGVEEEQKTITDYLIKGTDELDVVAVVGRDGLGKTTLARRIYQSELIQSEFPGKDNVGINASQDLNKKDVFLDILKEVSSKDMSSVSDDELASTVYRFLEKKNFLIVLDNVWKLEEFIAVLGALPKSNGMGCRVLITSYREVIDSARRSHNMRNLSETESWELLQLEVFGELNACPLELMDLARDIAGKCEGLALTIVIVGGILVDQLSKTQSISALKKAWIELSEYMGRNDTMDTDMMVRVVELSYDRLSGELRNLFLYLGVFPAAYEIPASTLTRLWIAELFIQHQEGRSLEDIAEEKLNHLIQRKLVIVDKVRSNGKVKSCGLQDVVHNFCVLKGGQMKLFLEIESIIPLKTIPMMKKIFRLCNHSNLLEFFSSRRYFPSVHSFLCFYKTESLLLPENTSKIPGYAFNLLRILDIKPIRFTRFPLELTQLFCLRYVVLSSDFKILPEAISMLRNIQTLTIHTSSPILEIKADIWKMIQLRHLQTNASIILRKEPENHSEQELQTLTNLSPDNCTSSVVHRARYLKKLGIRGMLPILLDGEVGSRKFDNFEKLENLKLLNDVHMSTPSECRLSSLPPTKNFPPKLRSLTLSATFLSWEHMSVLGMLEKLEVLKLKDNAFVGEYWEVADDSFPSLQVLQIGYTDLVSWKVSRGHFPELRSLALRNCEKLEALPQELAAVLSLEEIELLRPSKALTASTRKIVEKRQQIEGKHSRMKLTIYFPADE